MQFLWSHWRSLDLPTRIKIANALGIPKTGSTHVSNNVIESDGYAIQDVENALSLENLQKYLNTTETNMEILWNWLLVGKPEVISEVTATPEVPLPQPTSTKRGKRK